MLQNKEPLIACPFSSGGYAVRPINWAGIWDENGKLKSSCNVTAVFADEEDAKEYCQIMNEPLRMAGMILSDELNKRGDWYEVTKSNLVGMIRRMPDYVGDIEAAHEAVEMWLEERLLPQNPLNGSFESTFTIQNGEDYQKFVDMLRDEMKVIDITGYSDETILKIIAGTDGVEKLVTTDPEHYEMLGMSRGYVCNTEDYDVLYGVPIVLDQYKELKTAKIRFEKRGSD